MERPQRRLHNGGVDERHNRPTETLRSVEAGSKAHNLWSEVEMQQNEANVSKRLT